MSIDELTSAIAANVSQVNEAIAGSQQAGSQAEELSGTFAGLGAESQAATLSATQSQLAEAAQIGASYVAKLQEAAATAESAKGAGLSGTGGISEIAPSDHREKQARAGAPLKAVEEVNADDDASPLTRLLRKSDDVADASKTTSEAVHSLYKALNGPAPAYTGTADPGPVFKAQEPLTGKPDPVLTVAMGVLVLARAVQLHKRKRKSDD